MVLDVDVAAGALDARQSIDGFAQLRSQQVDVATGLGQKPAHAAALLVEQGNHQVSRFNELVILADGQRLGFAQRHLEFACQFVHSHGIPSKSVME